MAEAWLRRGSPFVSGYAANHGDRTILPYSGRAGFSYPLLLGIASILFSFGRGLVFFSPGLVLWLDSLSVWVGFIGAVTNYSELTVCSAHHYAFEAVCWYVPEFSSLWWPVLHPPALSPASAIVVLWCVAVFVYLALPLGRAIVSELWRVAANPRWAHGWHL
jgi:hypothetical protein